MINLIITPQLFMQPTSFTNLLLKGLSHNDPFLPLPWGVNREIIGSIIRKNLHNRTLLFPVAILTLFFVGVNINKHLM